MAVILTAANAINVTTENITSKQYSSTTRIIHKHKFKNYISVISNPEALSKILNRNNEKDASTTVLNFVTIEKLSELFQSTTIRSKFTKEIISDYKDIPDLDQYIKITYKGGNSNAKFVSKEKIVDIIFPKSDLTKTAKNSSENSNTSPEENGNIYTGINNTDKKNNFPNKNSPGLSVIQIINPNLRSCLKHSEELSIFFNLINTLDMSMAVPYLNIKFFLPSTYKTSDSQNSTNAGAREYAVASFNNFFFGYSAGKKQESENFTNYAKAINGDYYINTYSYKKPIDPNILISTGNENSSNQGFINVEAERKMVDISLFTMPQSLVNGDEKIFGDYNSFSRDELSSRSQPVQDKFRPFMSIESIDFDVRPTKELMSFKTATLNMVLYDKSRLNEVLSFVKPDLFGSFGSEILLQYGWQHVLGDPEYTAESELSPIGEFINSLKCYEKYQIVNSSYSIQENGQVNITLNISMKGPADIRGTKFDLNFYNYALSKNTSLYLEQLKNILFYDTSSDKTYLSSKDLDLSIENLSFETLSNFEKKLNESHENAKRSLSDSNMQASMVLLTELKARIDAVISKLKTELNQRISANNQRIQSNLLNFLDTNDDPFLNFEKYRTFSSVWEKFNESNKSNIVSLGKIILGLLGKNIVTTYQYDEVQLVFFNLNEKAIRARGLNIAEIPIEKETFKKWFLSFANNAKQVSIEGVISIILQRYVNEKAADVYGLNEWLKLTENSETKYIFENDQYLKEASDVKKQDDSVKYQASILNEIKNQYYGENTEGDVNEFDLTFKLPNVRMSFDTLTHHHGDEKTILRINFYDENDNPFESLFDLLGNFQNDQLKNKISEINYLVQQISTVGNNNSTDYKKRADSLISQLKKLGIIEYYDSNSKPVDNISNAKSIKIQATSELTKNRSFNSLKILFKELLPSITFGASNSAAISANVSSMQDAKLSTVLMTRDEENSAKSVQYQMFENQNLLPTRIIPSQVSAKIIGCPLIHFGQMIFFDFNTNTTVDNAYIVTGIKHSISPGKFETDLTLTLADGYAKFLANSSTIKTFIEIAKNLKEEKNNQETNVLTVKEDFLAAEEVKKIDDQIQKIQKLTANYLFRISIL